MTMTAMKASRREVRKTVKALTEHAKQCKITEAPLREQLGQFEKALKNRGTMKAASHRNRGSMMQSGGKRRRPKSR